MHSIDFDDKSQLSRAEGRNEFIITTSKYIYLYIIQLEEIKPKLKNVLYNFMMCDLMITGPKNIYNVTYNHG